MNVRVINPPVFFRIYDLFFFLWPNPFPLFLRKKSASELVHGRAPVSIPSEAQPPMLTPLPSPNERECHALRPILQLPSVAPRRNLFFLFLVRDPQAWTGGICLVFGHSRPPTPVPRNPLSTF